MADTDDDSAGLRGRSDMSSVFGDTRPPTPIVPPGLGNRPSTPSIPPGFGIHHSHPDPSAAPFTPSRILANLPRVATPLANVSLPSSPSRVSKAPESSVSQAKVEVKTLATSSGLSKAIALQSSVAPQGILQSEQFPALDSSKSKPSIESAKVVSSSKTGTSSKKSAGQTASKARTPGVLTITATTKPPSKVTAAPDVSGADVASAASSFPPLPPPSTPAASSNSVSAPAQRLHVVTSKVSKAATKVDTPIAGTPSSATSVSAPTLQGSRHPSAVSSSKFERSGTPTSEIISDNASITSASISRASSPPPMPSKIGSAPVRQTTKSMLKKQRREKGKGKLELDIIVPPIPEQEPEIAPIMGRKKKQKKDKVINSAAGGSTPAASRPPSPGPLDPVCSRSQAPESAIERPRSAEKEVQNVAPKIIETKAKGKNKPRPVTPEPIPSPVIDIPYEEEVVEKIDPTPASVYHDLQASGVVADINGTFLKQPSIGVRHQESHIDLQSSIPKLAITAEDRAALLAGHSVRKNVDGSSRIMLTPNGDCVRNLSHEEEERFLELQFKLSQQAGPAAFFSAKHHASNGFTLIGGRAVPNGPPTYFPQPATSPTLMDPIGKIHRDEALNYINQYVLPSLSTNSQLERALNANALESENQFENSASWPSWTGEVAGPDTHPDEVDGSFSAKLNGSLASGLETMTAHFAIGRDIDRGAPLVGGVSLLTLPDAESAMQLARKETENLEKKLNALLKKNRRLILGSGH